jgi:putative transcriptional regulator
MPRKKSSFGSQIIGAFDEFLDDVREGRPINTRTIEINADKVVVVKPAEVQKVRAGLGLSQRLFANFIGTAPVTVQKWEQGSRRVPKMAGRFLAEIRRDLPYWRRRLAESARSK